MIKRCISRWKERSCANSKARREAGRQTGRQGEMQTQIGKKDERQPGWQAKQ